MSHQILRTLAKRDSHRIRKQESGEAASLRVSQNTAQTKGLFACHEQVHAGTRGQPLRRTHGCSRDFIDNRHKASRGHRGYKQNALFLVGPPCRSFIELPEIVSREAGHGPQEQVEEPQKPEITLIAR
ncbi:MAG: hypothetical protein AAFO86_06795 [Pseudomonadota bacterium]